MAGGTHPRGFVSRFLAEGATNAFFQVRLALLNVGTQPARLLRRDLEPGGRAVPQFEVLEPGRRRTLTDADLTDLTSPDFSTVIESDQPLVVDRTMSWGDGGYGSHAELVVPSPATTWYLAGGAARPRRTGSSRRAPRAVLRLLQAVLEGRVRIIEGPRLRKAPSPDARSCMRRR